MESMSTPPGFLDNWLIVAMFLLNMVATAAAIWSVLRRQPKLEEQFADKAEVARSIAAHESRVDELAKETNVRFAEMSRASSAGREKIYGCIAEINKSLSATETEMRLTGQQVSQLSIKLDRLIERKA